MKLEKKVHAVNEVNRLAKLALEFVLPELQKYVGQKIYLVNGDKASKFNIEFPELQPNKFEGKEYALLHNTYLHKSYKSVYFKLSCSFKNTDATCFYEDINIWVGDLDDSGQVLTNVRTEEFPFKNYNVEEIKVLLKRKEQVEKELSEVKSKLRDFVDFHYQ